MTVDLYELIRRLYAEERDVMGGGLPTSDLYAVVHPVDYDGIVRAADDLAFSMRYANVPHDPLNAIIGTSLEIDQGIAEPGYIYLRRRSNLYYTARVEIPSKPEPRAKAKPDNSPMIGGQHPDITGNEPMLGSKTEGK